MKILLTNDDGYNAKGIVTLFEALKNDFNVTIVAPKNNKSAVSHSISILKDIEVKKVKDNIYWVNGTPADCVRLVKGGMFGIKVDLIISGINQGPNMGYDVLYSGTVAAAREGQFEGIPSIAVSISDYYNAKYENAAKFIKLLLTKLEHINIPDEILLNINVPVCDKIEGAEFTKLGHVRFHEQLIKKENNKFRFKWELPKKEKIGTDIYAVSKNKISITPLHLNISCKDTISKSQQFQNILDSIVETL